MSNAMPVQTFMETLDLRLRKVTLNRALNLYRLYSFVANNAGAIRLPQDTEAIKNITYYGFDAARISRDLKCLSTLGVIKKYSSNLFGLR